VLHRQKQKERNYMNAWKLSIAALAGVVSGFWGQPIVMALADHTATIIKNLLELVSLPIIFLSIVSSIAGMESGRDARIIGSRALRYTVLTTVLAALVGLVLFLLIDPVGTVSAATSKLSSVPLDAHGASYMDFLLAMVPSNLVQVFSGQGSVMAVVFVGLLFGAAIISLPTPERVVLSTGFSAFFSMMITITRFILRIMPLAVWAFTALFVQSTQGNAGKLVTVGWYVVTVLAANILQGFVILPLFLWIKGLSPYRLFKAFRPALGLAFVSKSSNITLPVTLECAQSAAGISPRIARFCLPLCATINMNGCAAFILITVLFVAASSGMQLSAFDLLAWVLLSTLAAVGNAGVPMGCFFLTSAFLSHLHLPLELMGLILPIYALIDMVETALNVWSDSCVTAVVDKELRNSHE
jgi:Na+/H+-dicarboxylate symporter